MWEEQIGTDWQDWQTNWQTISSQRDKPSHSRKWLVYREMKTETNMSGNTKTDWQRTVGQTNRNMGERD